ncbi:MAG TPA: S9 family peptidase [Candidatus Eisenbacteria bacterium]|jgi:dipeptidyl aminopeptidase/acylaminoacyl peptidase
MRRARIVTCAIPLASTLLACAAAYAARGEPYRLEDALTLRTFADLTWSRDGSKLAFVVTEVDTAENSNNQDIWLVDFRRGETLRLTRHPKPDVSPTFSPGGDTIAFVATRATGDDARPAIYMMSLHGGDPWPFGTYAEGIGEVRWSPDGKYLAYVMTDTLPRQVKEWRKKKWDHVVEDERLQYPRLWVVEIASGKPRRLTSGESYLWNVRWSPDSRSIAFITSPTGKPDDGNQQDVGVVPVEGGPVHTLGVIGDAFAWSPDGRSIALASGGDRAKWVEKSDLWVAPAAGGKALNLTADFDGDADTPAWSPGSDTLYFHAAQGVTTRLAAAPVRGARGGVTLGLDRDGEAGAPVVASNGRIAWVQSQARSPAEVWVAERAGLTGRAVTSLNAEVATRALGGTRPFRWTSNDGARIEGLLLRPPGAAQGAPLKTLVLLHGGPYASRYTLGFLGTTQYFAARGYQIFMPNFRSSGGYGTAFMLRKRSNWGGQDWRDVMIGIDSLVAAGLADGAKLGVFGHSYGGYLSAWAITQTDRFDAACVSAGAMDLASHFGQSDIHKYRAYDFEGYPWQTPENWDRSSPSTYIMNARTPTLILSGEEDRRVPYPQGQQLYAALTALNVPTEFVHYPREGHSIREYRHRADYYARILKWFDRWIR